MFSYGFKHSIFADGNQFDIIENNEYCLFVNKESFLLQYKILMQKKRRMQMLKSYRKKKSKFDDKFEDLIAVEQSFDSKENS